MLDEDSFLAKLLQTPDLQKLTGLAGLALECFGVLWSALECFGVLWNSVMHGAALLLDSVTRFCLTLSLQMPPRRHKRALPGQRSRGLLGVNAGVWHSIRNMPAQNMPEQFQTCQNNWR